ALVLARPARGAHGWENWPDPRPERSLSLLQVSRRGGPRGELRLCASRERCLCAWGCRAFDQVLSCARAGARLRVSRVGGVVGRIARRRRSRGIVLRAILRVTSRRLASALPAWPPGLARPALSLRRHERRICGGGVFRHVPCGALWLAKARRAPPAGA